MAVETNTLRIVLDSRGALKNAEDLDKKLTQVENTGIKAAKSSDLLSSSLKTLAVYMGGIVTVGAAIEKMDAYTNLQNRLKLVTSSQQDLNKATQDTFRIAQQSYQAWDSVVQVYQRFSDNAKTLNISMDQTARLTETVSKAVAVSGASAQAADAALTQFGQALASGTLRGEELNSVMEQTPALAKAIAQGMGITVGELRAVAAEGKITGDVLVDALTKASDSVDDLFSKTDITIGQSLTLLNNEVQRFVGEASQGSGAATMLAESIKFLAQNLSLVADVAVIGGIAYLTKAFASKAIAVQASIAATVAERAATAAQTQASIAAATATLNEAKAHLANVQATNAATQAKFGATAAAIRYKQASDAVTAALAAQTAAQTGLNAAATIGSRALALVGGPIGAITLGVTALTAGYMYFSNKAAEANARLEEQGKVANKTAEELRVLNGVQRDKAVDDLTASFEAQNRELNKLNLQFNGFLNSVKQANLSNREAIKIYDDARQGIISQSEALERLNKLDILTPQQRAQGVDLINTYEEARVKAQQNADAQKVFGIEVRLAGNAAENAAGQARDKANAMNQDANSTRDAAQANREYTASLQQRLFDQAFITRLVTKHNKTQQEANLLLEAHKKTNGQISKQDKELIAGITAQQKALENYGKAQSATSKARTGAAKSANAAAAKEARDATRAAEEAARMREEIAYRYASKEKQIEIDLQKELADIRKSGASSVYAERATNRANIEKQIYKLQLDYELNEHNLNEEQKFRKTAEIKQLELNLNDQLTAKELQASAKALNEKLNLELKNIQLQKNKRLLAANEVFLSETDAIKKRYELERREIELNKSLSQEERDAMLRSSYAQQNKEESGINDDLIGQYRNMMGYEENPLVKQFELLDKLRERDLINEEAYQAAKLKLQAQSTASYMEGMLGGFAALVDENSKTYAVLFAAQKAFAVAQALLNIPAAYSKAYDAVVGTPYVGPYIAPAIGAAAAALQVAQAAQIKSTSMQGFKTGGYTGSVGTSDVAGVVHGQEYVLNADATRRVGVGTLDAINNGADLRAASARGGAGEPNVNLNPNFVIVDERENIGDYLFGADGKKAFVKFFKQNRRELGLA